MSEQILGQILQELKQVNVQVGNLDSRIDKLDGRMNTLHSRIDKLEKDITDIKVLVTDIPLIKQAVIETQDTVKKLEASQQAFERETTTELTNHAHSIDILNRRQLQLEAVVQSLKEN